MAGDDYARIAFTTMQPNERKHEAAAFLHNVGAHHEGLGVHIKRLLTDNGAAFRSREFATACKVLGVRHKFVRPYQPRTNGKAKQLIPSSLLRLRRSQSQSI